MLNWLIHFALGHRVAVIGGALLVLVFGLKSLFELPVEVLPDLTKPTVTVLTEAPGLAPEVGVCQLRTNVIEVRGVSPGSDCSHSANVQTKTYGG